MKRIITFAVAIVSVTLLQPIAFASGDHSHGHEEAIAQEQRVESRGTLNSIDAENRTVNISHGPIVVLDWQAMTTTFSLTESVDLAALHTGEITFVLLVAENGSHKVDEIVGANGHSHSS